MKSLRKKLGVGIGLSSLSMIIAACGGDTTNNYTSGIDIVSKAKDLPKCTSDNEGDQVFVKENDAASVCVDGKWKALGGSSSIDTVIVSSTDTLFVSNSDTVYVSGRDTVYVSSSDTVYVSSSDTIYVSGGDVDQPVETPDDSTSDSEAVIKNLKLSGFSQKGPFVNGARVLAYELANNRTLSQTGRSYRGDIVTNDGLFNIDVVSLASQYVILEGDGYYMNEVTGEKSNGPIKLNAITDLQSRSNANINLLTHLEYFRVQELVNNGGMKLNLAKAKAEKELFAAFHITGSDNFENTEDLNIFSAGDGNAALLAISILLQRDNSVADLTSELSTLSNAFKTDGSWGDLEKRAEIADWALEQDAAGKLKDYRTNVEGWGLSKTVPNFEKFIRKFYGQELGVGICDASSKKDSVWTVSNERSAFWGLNVGCENGDLKYGFHDSRDGKIYRTVRIGEQSWMAENLNYDYNEGTAKSYCYKNSADSCAKYGRLYLWSAAMDSAAVFSDAGKGCGDGVECKGTELAEVRGVCPEGWHLPSKDEWNTLFTAVGGSSTAGTKLKSTSGWNNSGNGVDSFGFSVLPAGYYDSNHGDFGNVGNSAYFWSSTEDGSGRAYYMSFYYLYEVANVYSLDKRYARSVRCVRNSN